MPKQPSSPTAVAESSDADVAPREPLSPIEAFWLRADALHRSAKECCRQHERFAHLVQIGALEMEQRAAQQAVLASDEALEQVTAAYEKCCGKGHPGKEDEGWQRANALWLASRDYTRRHRTSDRAAKGMNHGDAARFAELAVDYDLEASALLALKHAAEAYRKCRPGV
jgi:hypothetical protein